MLSKLSFTWELQHAVYKCMNRKKLYKILISVSYIKALYQSKFQLKGAVWAESCSWNEPDMLIRMLSVLMLLKWMRSSISPDGWLFFHYYDSTLSSLTLYVSFDPENEFKSIVAEIEMWLCPDVVFTGVFWRSCSWTLRQRSRVIS